MTETRARMWKGIFNRSLKYRQELEQGNREHGKLYETGAQKLWRWIIGCAIVSAMAGFIGSHWLEYTAGSLAVVFLIAGVVTEIDDRLRAVEYRHRDIEDRLTSLERFRYSEVIKTRPADADETWNEYLEKNRQFFQRHLEEH